MARKEFKNNPAMNFISPETISKVDGEQESNPGRRQAPEGYKLNPEYIETRSKRVQILIQPSVFNAVKERAQAEGVSVNEIINTAIKTYIEVR